MEIAINDEKHLFIRVSRDEAMTLIQSLSSQIVTNNSDTYRDETFATNGVDVTIAVKAE